MRHSVVFCCVLVYLFSGTAYPVTDQTNGNHLSTLKNSSKKTTIPNPSVQSKKLINSKTIDSRRFFANASAIYALMSDGGINGTSFALTAKPNGEYNAYMVPLKPNWGYEVLLGYKADPTGDRFSALSYISIKTSGTKSVSVAKGGDLYNDLSQASASGFGFHILLGPAKAVAQGSINYQNIALFGTRPGSDDGGTKIQFTKSLGVRVAHIGKNLTANYEGYAPDVHGEFVRAKDQVTYSSNYYGIGPQYGLGAFYRLNQWIEFKGGGSGAILAGYYNSNLKEVAHAEGKIFILDSVISSDHYEISDSHPTQAWTPLIFKGNFSVILNALHNKKTGLKCAIEAGITDEYILPTQTDDSYTPNAGDELVRFNNSLNLAYVYVKASLNLD